MKYSSLGGNGNSSSGRWRFKSTTVKAFMICLFAISGVFITYQLIYYVSLTEYQNQETQNLNQERLSEVKSTTSKHLELQFDKFEDNLVVAQVVDGGGQSKQEVHFERKKGKPVLSSKIIGVKPSDLHLYTDQQLNRNYFKCLSTSKQIKWEKVNDEYCDCPLDGSDEPSTSACLNGKFYCLLNKDGSTGYITSSRVNDGICDCADGTDEHLGVVKCKKD